MCNVLEDNGEEVKFDTSGAIIFEYSPFKIMSFKLTISE